MQYNEYLIIGVTPTNNETGVSVSTSAEVLFSEAIDANTITPSTIYLQNTSSGSVVTAELQYVNSDTKAVLTPVSALEVSTIYRLIVLGGENGIMTLDGEYMFETKYYDFTTEESGTVEEPVEEPVEESALLFEVSVSYPKNNDVHVNPESIKILFTDAIDPLTVDDQSVYLLKKRNPNKLTAIDLITDYSPSKGILDTVNNPITLEQNNTIISIQLNEGDLEENEQYTVVVRESISSSSQVQLGEAYMFGFYSTFNPMYGDPERIRSDVGNFIDSVSDNALYNHMHQVSLDARDIVTSRDSTIDLSVDTPNYVEQYVRTKAGYDLLVNGYVNSVNEVGVSKTLGDLNISKNSKEADVSRALKEFKERIRPWLDQLHGKTNRGYAKPSGVVKGEVGGTYPGHLTRTDFTGMEG